MTTTRAAAIAPQGTFPVADGATVPVTWDREEQTEHWDWVRTHTLDDGTVLTVTRLHDWHNEDLPQLVLRLYDGGVLVSAGKVFGVPNWSAPGNALCWIETHPDHRGHRYAARMVLAYAARYGTVYRSGTMTAEGAANAKYLDLPLTPGGEVNVRRAMQPNARGNLFMDWETGHPDGGL